MTDHQFYAGLSECVLRLSYIFIAIFVSVQLLAGIFYLLERRQAAKDAP